MLWKGELCNTGEKALVPLSTLMKENKGFHLQSQEGDE